MQGSPRPRLGDPPRAAGDFAAEMLRLGKVRARLSTLDCRRLRSRPAPAADQAATRLWVAPSPTANALPAARKEMGNRGMAELGRSRLHTVTMPRGHSIEPSTPRRRA